MGSTGLVDRPLTRGLNLIRAFPQRQPATHFEKRDGERFAGPLCGQRDIFGKHPARTLYTRDPDRVTCRKCRRALGILNTEV